MLTALATSVSTRGARYLVAPAATRMCPRVSWNSFEARAASAHRHASGQWVRPVSITAARTTCRLHAALQRAHATRCSCGSSNVERAAPAATKLQAKKGASQYPGSNRGYEIQSLM